MNEDFIYFLNQPALIFMSGETHKRHRKMMRPPFHGQRMATYSETMARLCGEHVERWPDLHDKFFTAGHLCTQNMQEISVEKAQALHDLTKEIAGVNTIVAFVVDVADDEIVEKEIAFYAQDDDGNVWFFGEYPEEYEDGKLVDAPTWIAGIDDAKVGIKMKADPRITPVYAVVIHPLSHPPPGVGDDVNQWVYQLINKGHVLRRLPVHEVASALARHLLGAEYLLSSMDAHITYPGNLRMPRQ